MTHLILALLPTIFLLTACRSITPSEGNSAQVESKVYVANRGSNSISVIDVASDEVIKTIPAGQEPVGMAFSPDQSVLAVVNKGSGDIWLIDTRSDEVFRKIPLGNNYEPLKLVYGDTNLLLIAAYKYGVGTNIILVNLERPTHIDSLTRLGHIGRPITGMVASGKHNILCITGHIDPLIDFIPDENQPGTLINYRTEEVIIRAHTNGFGAVITPDEKYIYVNNLLGYFVKWDVEAGRSYPFKVIHTFAGDMVYKKEDEIRTFYRVNSGYPMLDILSLEDTTHTNYPLPYTGDYLEISNRKNQLYIVHTERNEISVYDLSQMAIIKTISVGENPIDIVIK